MELINLLANQDSILALLLGISYGAILYLYLDKKRSEKDYREELRQERSNHLNFAKETLINKDKVTNEIRESISKLVVLIQGQNGKK